MKYDIFFYCRRVFTCDHLTKQLFRCVAEERHTAHQELVEDDAYGPPVHRLAITLPQDHLRRDVLWGAANLGLKVKERFYAVAEVFGIVLKALLCDS